MRKHKKLFPFVKVAEKHEGVPIHFKFLSYTGICHLCFSVIVVSHLCFSVIMVCHSCFSVMMVSHLCFFQ